MAAQGPAYAPQPAHAGTTGSMPSAYGAPGQVQQLVAQTTQIGANVHVPHLAAPPASMQFSTPQLRGQHLPDAAGRDGPDAHRAAPAARQPDAGPADTRGDREAEGLRGTSSSWTTS
ncbi:unnamed protein product [Prorocentrum cordatum]|uniref:Uncharacterized protein n=1 Tax=Prorocentrum cordatum TaxID=2364126 RepID=A0ABN9SLI2_9DINO|nr:unnamed protein product [Polarella glacialis]